MERKSNRPEGLPTTRALMWFWIFTTLLLLDVVLWQHMQLVRMLP